MRPYGQHFLKDHNVLKKIIRLSALQSGDRVLEIGPGEGVLTQYLLEAGCQVLSVEIDRKLEHGLRQRFDHDSNFTLMMGDALHSKHRLSEPLVDKLQTMANYHFVSNLPYSAGTPILLNLWQSDTPPESAVVMLQKEVGERITANPGHKSYGTLSILLANVADSAYETTVPPQCFDPPPTVDSCLVSMKRISPPRVPIEPLKRLVNLSFSQRRKQIGKRLRKEGIDVTAVGLTGSERAEEIGQEQFFELSKQILP